MAVEKDGIFHCSIVLNSQAQQTFHGIFPIESGLANNTKKCDYWTATDGCYFTANKFEH